MCSAARGMAVTYEEGHRAVPQWWCTKGQVMTGCADSCHGVAPHTVPLACPRRISDAPQPAIHRLIHLSPHPTYAAPLPRTPRPLTTPLILHTSYRLPLCSADEMGSRYKWPGSGGPEGDPVVRKGTRWSGRGSGGPERGPVVRKGPRDREC